MYLTCLAASRLFARSLLPRRLIIPQLPFEVPRAVVALFFAEADF